MSVIKKIAILDYGMGNIFKIKQAVEYNKFACSIIRDLKNLDQFDGLILPGVGSFAAAMKKLDSLNAKKIIRKFIKTKKLLGICLGMQLLLNKGEEIKLTKGLGFISGNVVRFPKNIKPHVGWNIVNIDKQIKYKNKINNKNYFYFTHQFIVKPSKKYIFGTTKFCDIEFASVIKNKNVYGVQFHPENSTKEGAKFISTIFNDH